MSTQQNRPNVLVSKEEAAAEEAMKRRHIIHAVDASCEDIHDAAGRVVEQRVSGTVKLSYSVKTDGKESVAIPLTNTLVFEDISLTDLLETALCKQGFLIRYQNTLRRMTAKDVRATNGAILVADEPTQRVAAKIDPTKALETVLSSPELLLKAASDPRFQALLESLSQKASGSK